METTREDQLKFLIICLRILLRIGNVQRKFVEKIKTHILHSVTFFFFENRARL